MHVGLALPVRWVPVALLAGPVSKKLGVDLRRRAPHDPCQVCFTDQTACIAVLAGLAGTTRRCLPTSFASRACGVAAGSAPLIYSGPVFPVPASCNSATGTPAVGDRVLADCRGRSPAAGGRAEDVAAHKPKWPRRLGPRGRPQRQLMPTSHVDTICGRAEPMWYQLRISCWLVRELGTDCKDMPRPTSDGDEVSRPKTRRWGIRIRWPGRGRRANLTKAGAR
jgi:hypothetical protein